MQVFETILPIVAIAALGWLLRRRGVFSDAEAAVLERFTFYFLLPFLLFLGTATAEFPDQLDWGFLLGFYLSVVLVYGLGIVLGKALYAYSPRQQSVFGMGGAYSNVTLVGIPVCLEILGEAAFLPMFVIIAAHNMTLFGIGALVAERGASPGAGLATRLYVLGRGLVLNPITGPLLAGVAVNLLGIPLYGPLTDAMGLLGRAAVPCALFVLGASLVRYRVRGELGAALWMTGLKLLLLPAAVWTAMFRVFAVPATWGATAVLLAAMPVGVSVFVWARRQGCCEAQAGAAIVLSSVLAVFSIGFWGWVVSV